MSSEKTYTIRVVAESDTGQLEDLQVLLEQLSADADNASSSLSGMDTSGLSDVSSETENASEAMTGLDASAQSASDSVSSFDSSNVRDVGEAAEESSSSLSDMGAITSAVAAVGLGSVMSESISLADNYNVQIGALTTRFGAFGVSANQLTASIQSVTDATSISGSQARSFFLTMSNYGVTNTNALSAAMTTLYGQAALGGVSFDQASSAMQRMVASGNLSARVVTQLGTSLDTLSSNLGMTNEEFQEAFSNATPEQRLEMLTQAMGDTTAGIELMNSTAQASMAEVQQAFDQSLREIGEALLPVVVAGLQALLPVVQGLAAAMSNPIFAGFFGTLVIGATSLLALGSALKIVSLAAEGLNAGLKVAVTTYELLTGATTLNTLAEEGNTLAKIANAAAETASKGVRTASAALMALCTAETYAETTAKVANMTVTEALTAAMGALNAVLLANPFILVAVAVIALVAVLWYLYNTNEDVRNAIDGLWSALQQVAGFIVGALIGAWNSLVSTLQPVADFLVNVLGAAFNLLLTALQLYVDLLLTVYGTAWNTVLSILQVVADFLIGTFMTAWNMIYSALQLITNFLLGVFNSAVSVVMSILSTLAALITGVIVGAWNTLYSVLSKVAGFLSGTLNSAISVVKSVLSGLNSLVQAGASAWNSFASAVSAAISPLQTVYSWVQKLVSGGLSALTSALQAAGVLSSAAGDISEMSSTVTVDPNYKTRNELQQELDRLQLQLENNNSNENGQNVNNGDIIVNVGTVDSEERIQELVKELTRALSFNNTLAGRTI